MPQGGDRQQADRVSGARSGRSRPRGSDDRARRRAPACVAGAAPARAGRPVSAERIAEELWNGDPPAGASTTVRSYVSRLRAALGSAAPIQGGPDGYTVKAEPAVVDSFVFEQLTRDGEEALERAAVTRAAQRLREALTLWRGRPFGELGEDGSLRLEAERLEGVRIHALELRIEADLALGRDAELVDELESARGRASLPRTALAAADARPVPGRAAGRCARGVCARTDDPRRGARPRARRGAAAPRAGDPPPRGSSCRAPRRAPQPARSADQLRRPRDRARGDRAAARAAGVSSR